MTARKGTDQELTERLQCPQLGTENTVQSTTLKLTEKTYTNQQQHLENYIQEFTT